MIKCYCVDFTDSQHKQGMPMLQRTFEPHEDSQAGPHPFHGHYFGFDCSEVVSQPLEWYPCQVFLGEESRPGPRRQVRKFICMLLYIVSQFYFPCKDLTVSSVGLDFRGVGWLLQTSFASRSSQFGVTCKKQWGNHEVWGRAPLLYRWKRTERGWLHGLHGEIHHKKEWEQQAQSSCNNCIRRC